MTSYRIGIAWALTIGTILTLFFVGTVAHAQENEGLRISPAVIEDRANPGGVYNFSLTVTNISSAEKTFFLGSQDITGIDDAGSPVFSEVQTASEFEMSSWIKLPAVTVTLRANETREIPFSVQVPGRASPGSHFAAVFFDLRPPEQQTNAAAVGIKVGAVISLRIAGDIVEDALLREFSTSKLVYGKPSALFSTKVENLGNALIRPNGIIEITDMWGKQVGTVRVNETGAPVFPMGTRVYKASWDSDGYSFGRYQAVLSVVYGEDARKTMSRVTSFWVLPLVPILTILGVLFGGILALFLFVKAYIRKRLREMGVSPSRGADPILQMQRYSKPVSRLTTVFFSVAVFCIIFLLLLLYLFA